jgi:Icc-related predicted phosphoesterase
MLRVLHTSDLHGTRPRYKALLRMLETEQIDLWIDTGDFFPNRYWDYRRGSKDVEVPHQAKWFRWWKRLDERLMRAIQANPYPLKGILVVPGNHDYASLRVLLRLARDRYAPSLTIPIMEATHEANSISLGGRDWTFQGNSLIPRIPSHNPPWRGESSDAELALSVDQMLEQASSVDLLLTHAPMLGCLDLRSDAGVAAFHRLNARYHFHGHVHAAAGRMDLGGTEVFNGATKLTLLTLGGENDATTS